jgi:hypothetical protein
MDGKTATQASYVVRFVTPSTSERVNLRLSRQFTPATREAIRAAIKRAVLKELKRYIGLGGFDKSFRLQTK